jgi:hypothetical protein
MNAIAPSDRGKLDAHLASGDILSAFAVLQAYPDLRHTDLPGVEKATLKAIAVGRPYGKISLAFLSYQTNTTAGATGTHLTSG